MVALTSEPVMRALAYVQLLNDGSVYPSPEHVDAFVAATPPQTARDRYYSFDQDSTSMSQMLIARVSVSSTAAYLLSTGMVSKVNDGLELTAVGLAFHRGLEKMNDGVGDTLLEVVGRLEDPVTYSKLLTEIDKKQGTLLVDPYLPSAAMLTLLELPNVKRILTKDTKISGQTQAERRRHLAIALGARPEVELRFLPPSIRELHDRYVIPEAGEGLMIGTSLGGTQVTVVTHLGSDSTDLLREHYDDLWLKAEPLEPISRASPIELVEGSSSAPSAEQGK